MRGDAPIVRVIVVNFNSGRHLSKCLAALVRQDFPWFEAYVVDNGSTDGSLGEALPDDPRFHAVLLGENLGFGAANNRAAPSAATPFVALLNPDAFPEPNWLSALVAAAERHPDVAMFGSTQLDAMAPDRFDGVGDVYFALGVAWRGEHGRPARLPGPSGETFGPCAAAALVRTDAFLGVGGFDESFFCFYDDVDLAFRLRLKGERCLQVGEAVVHHVGSASAGRVTAFTAYHLARNQIWTFVKNMPGPLLWPLLPGHALWQAAVLCRSLPRGTAVPVAKGIRDAVKGLPAVWKARRQVQGGRTVSSWRIARALTWSPRKLWARAGDLRALEE